MDEGWLNSDVIVPYMCEAISYRNRTSKYETATYCLSVKLIQWNSKPASHLFEVCLKVAPLFLSH